MICGDLSRSNLLCLRPLGHDGPHQHADTRWTREILKGSMDFTPVCGCSSPGGVYTCREAKGHAGPCKADGLWWDINGLWAQCPVKSSWGLGCTHVAGHTSRHGADLWEWDDEGRAWQQAVCGADGGAGLTCTKPLGHTGDHAQEVTRGDFMKHVLRRPDHRNPKDIVGAVKLPLGLWPVTATALGSLALMEGELKYGRANYRAIPVSARIYVEAAMRHLGFWFEGEERAEDSTIDHLGHALACIAILVDARANKTLIDDRNYSGDGAIAYLKSLVPEVLALRNKYADAKPEHHYTINDNPPPDDGPIAHLRDYHG